jgi:hypothetical protein
VPVAAQSHSELIVHSADVWCAPIAGFQPISVLVRLVLEVN